MKTYLDMLQHILENGELISNGRTKEGYYSVFGYQNRYDLRKGFPALTTKKLFFRGIAVEMLWFLSGNTNVKFLQDNNVHIWDEWATKEQCAKFGREEGDLGPVYGALWRRWEAIDKENQYWDDSQLIYAKDTFGIKKIDQIQRVIDRIKTNPSCRRLIVSGWDPANCDQVTLPPCHTLFKFSTSHGHTRLNCHLFQRSGDCFLGIPFNIASYALLTHMVAQVTGLEVGEFIHTIDDLHLYESHIPQAQEQLTRTPLPLPKLWLNPAVKHINDFKVEDIRLEGYVSHSALKADVAV